MPSKWELISTRAKQRTSFQCSLPNGREEKADPIGRASQAALSHTGIHAESSKDCTQWARSQNRLSLDRKMLS